MQLSDITELQPAHALLWARFQVMNARQRLPHALLLMGSPLADIVSFAYKISALLFCSQEQNVCGQCKSCYLVQGNKHPDIYYLTPEKAGDIIKIDQIRHLHDIAYTSPQLTDRRIIILNPAEKMNTAAANALLKLLEEPPSCVLFLLIAEQISTLPPTIISRCQQWRFVDIAESDMDYLSMLKYYPPESERGFLFSQMMLIIQDLVDLKVNELSACALAEKWSSYDFPTLIWLIYLLNSQMIAYQFHQSNEKRVGPLYQLAQQFPTIHLFNQLNQLNEITKKLQKNIHFNHTLALESLLLGYEYSK